MFDGARFGGEESAFALVTGDPCRSFAAAQDDSLGHWSSSSSFCRSWAAERLSMLRVCDFFGFFRIFSLQLLCFQCQSERKTKKVTTSQDDSLGHGFSPSSFCLSWAAEGLSMLRMTVWDMG